MHLQMGQLKKDTREFSPSPEEAGGARLCTRQLGPAGDMHTVQYVSLGYSPMSGGIPMPDKPRCSVPRAQPCPAPDTCARRVGTQEVMEEACPKEALPIPPSTSQVELTGFDML